MLQLEIISPDETLFSGNVKLVQVPGQKNPFTVLNNHDRIISSLIKGKVRIVDMADKTRFFEIGGGVVEVNNNKIIILVDSLNTNPGK